MSVLLPEALPSDGLSLPSGGILPDSTNGFVHGLMTLQQPVLFNL